MRTRIDHLVIGAADLAQGVAYVKDLLGVEIPYGGEHKTMGTHNHVMRLGHDVFLEVLAINRDNDAIETPRWYGLDDPFVRRSIESQPALLAWVVNTESIEKLLPQAGFSFGKATLISRGSLSWHFGLTDDGRLLAGGMLPYVIEWLTDSHPSENMVDLGCRFQDLEIYHPYPAWLRSILESISAADLVKIHSLPKNRSPYLVAHIDTPKGSRDLLSGVSTFNR